MVLPPLVLTQFVPAAQGIAKAFDRALQAKDYAWFEGHLAPDFVYRSVKGERQDRASTLGHIRTWMHPLGYHVDTGLVLLASRKQPGGLLLLSELKVRSQMFGFRRMPLTETTVREESSWRPKGGNWICDRIVEKKTTKTVNGKPVADQ